MIELIYLPGDGYDEDLVAPFFRYLRSRGINPHFIHLQEEGDYCSYEQLEADNYCSYIDQEIEKLGLPKFQKYVGWGISKGCHWLKIYASKRPGKFSHIVLVEDTMMNSKNMIKFEEQRGNDFVADFAADDTKNEALDPMEKTLDSVVSDHGKYFPKCSIDVVWTTRDNRNIPYSADVRYMKQDYVKYLRNGGCKIKVHEIDSQHCVDTEQKFFGFLASLISH